MPECERVVEVDFCLAPGHAGHGAQVQEGFGGFAVELSEAEVDTPAPDARILAGQCGIAADPRSGITTR